MSAVKGIVFDMDGTLVNNMDFHKESWYAFLDKYGIKTTDEEFHEKNKGIISEIIPKFFPETLAEEDVIRLGEEKESVYRDLYREHIVPLDGLLRFLNELKAANIKLALATAADKPNIDFTIDAIGVRGYFLAITGGEEVKRGKPDPEVYNISAKKLGIAPSDCIAFEDSPAGIESALAAGMRVIALTTSYDKGKFESYPLLKIISDYNEISLVDLQK
jgi:beta-phosphoglucomutase